MGGALVIEVQVFQAVALGLIAISLAIIAGTGFSRRG